MEEVGNHTFEFSSIISSNFSDPFEICLPWINSTEPDVLRTRFYLISVFASSLAVFSIFENAILIGIFLIHFKGTHFLYLTFVACFDIIHATSYVMVMGVGIMYEYWENYWLKNIWLLYLIEVFTLSHVILCSSSYLLVAASFERCLNAHFGANFCSPFRRGLGVVIAICIGVTTKGTIYWEFNIQHYEQCAGTDAEYVIVASKLLYNENYKLYWAFYYRQIVTVFTPFILLVCLNSGIVLHGSCTCQDKIFLPEKKTDMPTHLNVVPLLSNSLDRNETLRIMVRPWLNRARASLRKKKKQAEKRTFAIIIGEHLFLVSLSVFITLWESIDADSLQRDYSAFHTIATDAVSIFTVVACSIRLPTYCVCDMEFRNELYFMIHFVCSRHRCWLKQFFTTLDGKATDVPESPQTMHLVDIVHEAMRIKQMNEERWKNTNGDATRINANCSAIFSPRTEESFAEIDEKVIVTNCCEDDCERMNVSFVLDHDSIVVWKPNKERLSNNVPRRWDNVQISEM